ncbi:fungal pheromone mating factor STE2 GPCR-domain-containing protein [Triangularia setosa]|uniref:Fungal pheromone mating factor STE2 GPCR-domain-containing protein n=1 Tax=Triangularia setosa TaxID=2587417 RepID=A0AAN7A4M9_9PEZI|nr:fungal pheromone mating factor STE2 GPCR-domain-containing protein [Podospora setosa]
MSTAISTPAPGSPSPENFNPSTQTFTLLIPGPPSGELTPVPLTPAEVSHIYADASSLSILYGSQIGACISILAVVLLMTPLPRFKRLPTIISILALALNTARMALLALFYPSSWASLTALFLGDYSAVSQTDINISVAATCLSVPVTMLIYAALSVQAWSMLSLWRDSWKWIAVGVSMAVGLVTVGFNFAGAVIQARGVIGMSVPREGVWVRQVYLGMMTGGICWFCFLFNVRLVMHMWETRSMLPGWKGLKAMDVLVICNGILMFVPGKSFSLFASFTNFESASLTQTSVIVVLPLGVLVAQRLAASPSPYCSPAGTGTGAIGSTSMSSNTRPRHQMSSMATQRPLLSHGRRGSAASWQRVSHIQGENHAAVSAEQQQQQQQYPRRQSRKDHPDDLIIKEEKPTAQHHDPFSPFSSSSSTFGKKAGLGLKLPEPAQDNRDAQNGGVIVEREVRVERDSAVADVRNSDSS